MGLDGQGFIARWIRDWACDDNVSIAVVASVFLMALWAFIIDLKGV